MSSLFIGNCLDKEVQLGDTISERTFVFEYGITDMELHQSEQPFRRVEPSRSVDPPRDSREGFEGKLNHILEAATSVVARLGYEKASMRSVASAAGVSLAGLYHYFDSKEKMLFLIQFRAFSALVSNLREKLHGVTGPIEQLRVAINAHVGYFVTNMASLKVCSHELDSLSGAAYEETRSLRRDYYGMVRTIVDRVLDEHDADTTIDRHIATMSLFGALNWLYRWYDPKRGPSVAVVAKQMTDQFLSGILHTGTVGRSVDGASCAN